MVDDRSVCNRKLKFFLCTPYATMPNEVRGLYLKPVIPNIISDVVIWKIWYRHYFDRWHSISKVLLLSAAKPLLLG